MPTMPLSPPLRHLRHEMRDMLQVVYSHCMGMQAQERGAEVEGLYKKARDAKQTFNQLFNELTTMIPPLKILVVEDDPTNRAYFCQVVTGAGHKVVAEAASGPEMVELVTQAMEQNCLGYLMKPVEPQEVVVAISVAWRNYEEFKAIRAENESLNVTLNRRKLVDQAKHILMRRDRIGEDEAFTRIQKGAMNSRRNIALVAQDVIDGKKI